MADGKRGPKRSESRIKVEKIYSQSILALKEKNVSFELTPENFKNLVKQMCIMKRLSDDEGTIYNITVNKINLFFHLNSPELAKEIIDTLKFLFDDIDDTVKCIEKVNEIVFKQVYNEFYGEN